MRLMFTGTHGIGKSATAIKLAEQMPDHIYIPSLAGPVAESVGFDINKPFTYDQLFDYQYKLFDAYIDSYEKDGGNAIYDRSLNDLSVYAFFGIRYIERFEFKRYVDFVNACAAGMEQYCDALVYPKASFDEPMEEKFNRPTDYNRKEFDDEIERLFDVTDVGIEKHIKVPIEYQFDDRLKYILGKL